MKRFISFFSIVSIIVLFMTSCGQENGTLRVVPKEAVFVVKMNAAQLLEKSEVTKLQEVQDEIKKVEDPAAKELIDQITKDPMSAGIDITKPVVFAITDIENGACQLSAAIKSKDDFKKTLEKCKTIKGNENAFEIQEGECCTITDNGHEMVAFDKEVLVVSLPFGSSSDAKLPKASSLLKLSKDASILSVEDCSDFINSKDDAAFYMQYNKILEQINTPEIQMVKQMVPWMKDLSYFASVNFLEGEANIHCCVYGGDEYKSFVSSLTQDPKGKFLSIIPSNSYFAAQYGIKDVTPILKIFETPEIKAQLDQLKAQQGIDIKQLLASLQGDIAFAVAPNAGATPVPYFVVGIECKDANLWNTLKTELAKAGGPITASGDGFDITTANEIGYDLHLGFKDNAITLVPKGNYMGSGDFTKSQFAASLKSSGAVIDIAGIMKNPALSQTDEGKILVKGFSCCKYITLEGTDTTSDTKVVLEKGKNSLALIVQAIVTGVNEYDKLWKERYSSYDDFGMNDDSYNVEYTDSTAVAPY